MLENTPNNFFDEKLINSKEVQPKTSLTPKELKRIDIEMKKEDRQRQQERKLTKANQNKTLLATGKISGGNRIDIFVPSQNTDEKRIIAVGKIQNGVITMTSEKPKDV